MRRLDAVQARIPFDAPADAEAKAREAIERAGEGASPWVRETLGVIHHLAAHRPLFTTDEVWGELDEEKPDEPRAMGAAMRAAARAGWIRSSQMARPSQRTVCNGRPVTIWKSLLLDGDDV